VRELAPPNAPELRAARRLLETCLEKEPNSRECLNGMAGLSFMAADLEAAKSFGDRLSRAAPEAAVTMLTQGRLKAAAGSYAAARVLFETACALERQTDACFRAEILRGEGY
jgi:tetratricopeptide (TPR) repeat protein